MSTPDPANPPAPPQLPSSIAGYRVDRVLGGGAMSTVYLAQHPTLPQWAALKVLPAELAHNPATRARFVHEGDTTAGLGHPNIVALYGRGVTEDGQLWIAMQYVKGTDAEAALQAGVMTPPRALRIVDEVAKVLDTPTAAAWSIRTSNRPTSCSAIGAASRSASCSAILAPR